MNPPNDDMERRLRAALDAHARQAPPGAPLADRILIEVEAPVLRPRRGWRTWSAPLLAAAAIVAAALALVGVGNAHFGASPNQPGATQGLSHQPTPIHPTEHSTAPTSSAPKPVTKAVYADTGGVHAFRAIDMSFSSATEGWALGSAKCLDGSPGRCTEIMHTTDGKTWTRTTGEAFNVPGVKNCADPCVEHLRFATSDVGYAYGPNALYLTKDGGAHWARQKGLGADALETLDGNVILVRAINASSDLFLRAPFGSEQWTSFTVPGFPGVAIGGDIQLSRSKGVALLAVTDYDPAKGLGSTDGLFRSTDSGKTWKELKRPCGIEAAGYHYVIAAATVAGSDGSLAVDCAVQTKANLTGFGSTVSAAPGTTKFVKPVSGGKLLPAPLISSPTGAVQLVVTVGGQTFRTDDTGNTWTALPRLQGISFIGFESPTDGRALGDNGRAVWTTHDAGATWSEIRFPV